MDLVNKNVVVVKKDGYKKYGLLLEVNDLYIVIKYRDGKEEIIGFLDIATVREDGDSNGR